MRVVCKLRRDSACAVVVGEIWGVSGSEGGWHLYYGIFDFR
jgi:hypothetical protein